MTAIPSSGTGQMIALGLVGLGRQMREVLLPAFIASRPWTIQAICDIDGERLDEFSKIYSSRASYSSVERMLDEERLDALIVAVGHKQNFPIISSALKHGVSVFVEKTPVNSVAEADELVRLQHQTGRWVMAGFNRRFAEPYRDARAFSELPQFGGIRMFQSQFHANRYDERAFVVNHVIHHLDLARFMLGEIEIADVRRIRVAEGIVGYTISFASEAGAIGTIQSGSMLDASFPVERLEVLGVGGNIVVDNLAPAIYNQAPGTAAAPIRQPSTVWTPTVYRAPHRNLLGYERELAHFASSIRHDTAPSPDIADARKTMALVERVDELAQL
jgi:predicted dehydrogenase